MIKVGNIYNTNNYGQIIILEELPYYWYNVKFINTGTIKKSRMDAIKAGCVRDPFALTKCGVACIGNIRTTGKYRKFYNVWQSMINRCYNKNDKRYNSYKNVTVSQRWLMFENFYNDRKLIDGWDEEKFNNGELVLDKDKKQRYMKSKIYSIDTCTWMSPSENAKMQDFQMRQFHAISPTGEIFKSDNITEFAKIHGLERRHVSGALHGRIKSTGNGWKFMYEEIV